ncbi:MULTISPECIES: hypothetical protein [unclassified Streptomyces]|uniref:hypothetical protein n=1 Tax=unclassified Streptomyces TaxID=2593676 RepID=UPI003D92B944
MTTGTAHPMAQEGRRVTYAFCREPDSDLSGVITRVDGAHVYVRLDGTRSNLRVHADYAGLRYLDELGPVPELPMGRFHPTAHDFNDVQYEGVLLAELADDDMVALTADPVKAVAAMNAHLRRMDAYDDVTDKDVELRWAYFEWEPPDAEYPWTLHWATADDDMAVRLHYLPA